MSKQEINLLHDYLFVLLLAAKNESSLTHKTPLEKEIGLVCEEIITEVELEISREETKSAEELEEYFIEAQKTLDSKQKDLENQDRYSHTEKLVLHTSMENELMLSVQNRDILQRRKLVDLREKLTREGLNEMHKEAQKLGIAVKPAFWKEYLSKIDVPDQTVKVGFQKEDQEQKRAKFESSLPPNRRVKYPERKKEEPKRQDKWNIWSKTIDRSSESSQGGWASSRKNIWGQERGSKDSQSKISSYFKKTGRE